MPEHTGHHTKRQRERPTGAAADRAASDGIPLGSVGPGKRVRLVEVDAGHGLASRLAAMGLLPGVELLVVSNRGKGPAVVEVKGTRLALGRAMTQKMRVR